MLLDEALGVLLHIEDEFVALVKPLVLDGHVRFLTRDVVGLYQLFAEQEVVCPVNHGEFFAVLVDDPERNLALLQFPY
jgi:hypothetical protein